RSLKICTNGKCEQDIDPYSNDVIEKVKPEKVLDEPRYEVIDDLKHRFVKSQLNNMIHSEQDNNKKLNRTQTFIRNTSIINAKNDFNNTHNITSNKRSMLQKNAIEMKLNNELEINDLFNETNDVAKIDRSVFDKKDMEWNQNVLELDTHSYKVVPKPEIPRKNKRINERGLIKILSMLTKTFKKIMKQHSDIKTIHKQLYTLNDDFTKSVDVLSSKFSQFDSKYEDILKVNLDLKKIEENLKSRERYFESKERELSKNLLDFENQQRKFLAQQRQFFGVQRLMLEQNEKINLKQNLIAKTQSEISQRQNIFARILHRAKQGVITSSAKPTLKLSIARTKNISKQNEMTKIISSKLAETTEAIKINLLAKSKVKPEINFDKHIMNDKDNQSIDDLIYKYYFNNTYIDDVMRNKILTAMADKRDVTKKKEKRNEPTKLKSTLLLPVGSVKSLQRERRWIKRSKKNMKKKEKTIVTEPKETEVNKQNPFIAMATSFCTEIGQNMNLQVMNWCVEKALRRLHIMDTQFTSLVMPKTPKNKINTTDDKKNFTMKSSFEELTTDNEGVVYYDGSLHSSDLGRKIKLGDDGGDYSELMPGLDSNSKIEVDPMAFDFDAKRRANVRRINENIRKMSKM
ncbi:unnamed protein product, partial [Leptidea sinapis]